MRLLLSMFAALALGTVVLSQALPDRAPAVEEGAADRVAAAFVGPLAELYAVELVGRADAMVSGTSATAMPLPWAPQPVRLTAADEPPLTAATHALVMDEASGAVLYTHGDPHEPSKPASLTKIVTAVVALEQGNLDEVVEVDVDSHDMPGSSLMGLRPGDRFTLRDLLYGLMLPSGNDAALAIGRHIAGSDAAFVEEMNALVRRLGLRDSHFANPHGLSAPEHYMSAYDLAMISRFAMTFPEFRKVVAASHYDASGSRTIEMRSLISGMIQWVPGVDGVKSGFTYEAGRTMVTSAVRDGRRVFAVVLNDETREVDSAALLTWAFDTFEWNGTPAPGQPAFVESPVESPTVPGAPEDDAPVEAARAD
ncbi:MAG: D-alanyl-D-alanine carboxypeptidase family protein [Dehalococcoidia bacterium]